MLEATGWQHLPCSGGLLDQLDALMEDLMTITWLHNLMKQQSEDRGHE